MLTSTRHPCATTTSPAALGCPVTTHRLGPYLHSCLTPISELLQQMQTVSLLWVFLLTAVLPVLDNGIPKNTF